MVDTPKYDPVVTRGVPWYIFHDPGLWLELPLQTMYQIDVFVQNWIICSYQPAVWLGCPCLTLVKSWSSWYIIYYNMMFIIEMCSIIMFTIILLSQMWPDLPMTPSASPKARADRRGPQEPQLRAALRVLHGGHQGLQGAYLKWRTQFRGKKRRHVGGPTWICFFRLGSNLEDVDVFVCPD